MYELPIREIRDGKVCRPEAVDWNTASGYCFLPADGPYIVLLVQRGALFSSKPSWAVLYRETLVEIYESELVKIGAENA